jgi:hypothetical protein
MCEGWRVGGREVRRTEEGRAKEGAGGRRMEQERERREWREWREGGKAGRREEGIEEEEGENGSWLNFLTVALVCQTLPRDPCGVRSERLLPGSVFHRLPRNGSVRNDYAYF